MARRENFAEIVDVIIDASSRVADIRGYERIVAATPEGTIVSEKIEGSDLADISHEDLCAITDEQIDDYVEAIIAGHARGIAIDPKPANVMYSPNNGFTIIDFSTQNLAVDKYKHSPNLALTWGVEPFIRGGLGDGDRGDTITDPNEISEIARLKLRIIEKYIKSAESHLISTENQNLYPYIDSQILYVQREAFDMEGLTKEREAFRAERDNFARNYDASKGWGVDSVF
jgi:serine/threonine protein kinase